MSPSLPSVMFHLGTDVVGSLDPVDASDRTDRLYFRQLLAGRDVARTDPVARQMVNFVYLIGDRETGEAMVVDPAYDVAGMLDVAAADGMRVTGALATHYHPDHVGGDMMGLHIEGIERAARGAPVPIHVQADEAPWVQRVTERRRGRPRHPHQRRRGEVGGIASS